MNLLNNIRDIHLDLPEGKYSYQNKYVPRVTEILSAMLHEDYLMEWSNRIGLYSHKEYKATLQRSADIGTYVHQSIENYLQNGIELDIHTIPHTFRDPVDSAFTGFLMWWDIIKQHSYKILMEERELVCEYFGGTLDLLLEIDGRIFLVDFKTSNHPSYKYFLQLSAYRYILREEHNINIDGCLILMLDKKHFTFRELVVDLDDIEDSTFMMNCENTFLSLVYAYYNRIMVERQYGNLFGKG